MQSLQLILKTSIFDKKTNLIITPELIEYNHKSFSKFEIADLRYGIKAIKGYRFRIGRIYCIDLRSLTGDVIKIRLISLYRIKKTRLEEQYKLVVSALLENFINDISRGFINNFRNKIDFNILGVTFTQEGIRLNNKSEIITWFDLGTKNYWTYFSLFSNSNLTVYKTFEYLNDWNTIVLYSVSRSILKAKNLL
jgi:hypothetical protein